MHKTLTEKNIIKQNKASNFKLIKIVFNKNTKL